MSKTAIILSAFGSSAAAHRRVREAILDDYQVGFPDCAIEIFLASSRVREAENLPDMATLLARLSAAGCERVVVQHLLLTQGQMFAEAQEMPSGLLCGVGAPLLSDDADMEWLAQVTASQVSATVPTILAVHGNTRNPQHNAVHMAFAQRLAQHAPTVVLASLEGEPGMGPLQAMIPAAQAAGGAHIIPLFVFPGGHVLDDLLGSDPSSWRSVLGVPCTNSPTLLEQPAVRQRFIAHTQAAFTALATE